MSVFVFEAYSFDAVSGRADFDYSNNGYSFRESVFFEVGDYYDNEVFQRALYLAFIVIGVSYYKTFPTRQVEFRTDGPDTWQAVFLNHVYQEGLGQFAFENHLRREDIVHFDPLVEHAANAVSYDGSGILALQSGGKDSLLTASLLTENDHMFDSLYVSSTDSHPSVVNDVAGELVVIRRMIDREKLKEAAQNGARNGHVPVTFIVMAIALLQAVLLGKRTVIASIGHEGEEPREWIGDLPVNHQWSKTWSAEQLFSEYVNRYISPDFQVGSPLRKYSELRIAELFALKAWPLYGHAFSSCNKANYLQGLDNTELKWCGECPKCANSFLLFAPFVEAEELKSLFNGQDLFEKPLLTETFKGLLSVDGVAKPFECIGEIDELRLAYVMKKDGYGSVPFAVPSSSFDYKHEYESQSWSSDYI